MLYHWPRDWGVHSMCLWVLCYWWRWTQNKSCHTLLDMSRDHFCFQSSTSPTWHDGLLYRLVLSFLSRQTNYSRQINLSDIISKKIRWGDMWTVKLDLSLQGALYALNVLLETMQLVKVTNSSKPSEANLCIYHCFLVCSSLFSVFFHVYIHIQM